VSEAQVLAEAARALPGIDFLRAIRDGRLPAAPMAELLGFRLVEIEPGHAVFEVIPGERHYNPIRLYAHATTTCIVLGER
jgi:acyl-coenzyme A thioesterase PaaI-like protein